MDKLIHGVAAFVHSVHRDEKALFERLATRHADPTRSLVEHYFPNTSFEQQMLAAIELNVLVQIEHLRLLPFVREACDAGRLGVHAWLYDIGAGEVRAFDSETEHFVRITDRAMPLTTSPVGKPADWPM